MNLNTNDSIKNVIIIGRSASKLSKRDFIGAYDDLMLIYSNDSSDVNVLLNLSLACDYLGKKDLALTYLFRIISIKPKYQAAYVNIGYHYQTMGEYQKSIDYFNKSLEINPDDAYGLSNRSYSKLNLGDIKGAYSDINESLKLYPNNSYAYRNRALIYIEDKKLKLACLDLEKALHLGFTTMYGEEVIDLLEQYCYK